MRKSCLIQDEHERWFTFSRKMSMRKEHWQRRRVSQIIGGMMMMTDPRVMGVDELKGFLSSSGVSTFKGSSRAEVYAWIERTLHSYGRAGYQRPG